MLPAELGGFAAPILGRSDTSVESQTDVVFDLHPHYRATRPLDEVLLKTKAGLDAFVTEKYADRITAILGEWSSGLLRSPRDINAIERSLNPDFSGSSPRPRESRTLRGERWLKVDLVHFASHYELDRPRFLQELQASMASFSKILTAEFQITHIETDAVDEKIPGRIGTRVRYEIVGAGNGFHREQRAGYWDMEWAVASEGEFRLRRWQSLDETQSRSFSPSLSMPP